MLPLFQLAGTILWRDRVRSSATILGLALILTQIMITYGFCGNAIRLHRSSPYGERPLSEISRARFSPFSREVRTSVEIVHRYLQTPLGKSAQSTFLIGLCLSLLSSWFTREETDDLTRWFGVNGHEGDLDLYYLCESLIANLLAFLFASIGSMTILWLIDPLVFKRGMGLALGSGMLYSTIFLIVQALLVSMSLNRKFSTRPLHKLDTHS